ncbi:MAG: hypothetical protein K1W21_09065, partial [Oscillospiraceae bacterium]
PKSVAIDGGQGAVSGGGVSLSAGSALGLRGGMGKLGAEEKAEISAEELDLKAQVYIRGERLEDFIIRIVAAAMGGF